MGFPGLYSPFGGVATVSVGRYLLVSMLCSLKDDLRRSEHLLSSM